MSIPPRNSRFFVAGGTLRLGTGSYIKRPADDELYKLILASEFGYVLAARQIGKSSLMIHTAQRLRNDGFRTVIIDLTAIGAVSVDEWYRGLLTEVIRSLSISTDLNVWWKERESLGQVQRFFSFLRDIVLTEIEEKVVIFIDEIDLTLSFEFRDNFFAAIRAMYNARAEDPNFNRLTIVLLGVAAPFDLIKDRTRTPFNISQGITLNDFNLTDTEVLQNGLETVFPDQGKAIFTHIYYWTNGHPYLTQKLCVEIIRDPKKHWTDAQIDHLVNKLFLSAEAHKETNLKFVQDMINACPQPRQLFTIYRQIYKNKAVPEIEQSHNQIRLKLTGLIKTDKGILRVRNEIYRQVFNLEWIKANTPVDWNRRITIAFGVLTLVLIILFWQQRQRTGEITTQVHIESFKNSLDSSVRLNSLSEIFNAPGNQDVALALFEELPSNEQIALFYADTSALQPQVRTVIANIYVAQIDISDDLLKAMLSALEQANEDDTASIKLAGEIGYWLGGRAASKAAINEKNEETKSTDYENAKNAYSAAIDASSGQNPATYYERALVKIAVEDYDGARDDFEAVLSLSEDWQDRVNQAIALAVTPTPTSTSTTTTTPSPTATPSPTFTPSATPSHAPMSTATPTATSTSTPTSTYTPTSTPTPTTIFGDHFADRCHSSEGSVLFDCKISSPSGEIYIIQLAGANSQFGVFNSDDEQLYSFSGAQNNDLKGMAFSPSGTQAALLYHYGTKPIELQVMDNLTKGPRVAIVLPLDQTSYHYLAYLTESFIALSISRSEDDGVVFGIGNGMRCTLAEWRANHETCP